MRNNLEQNVKSSLYIVPFQIRAAIQFKLLPLNYEFPVVKPKRQSYEWYHPKAILKRNWILKHLHVLPSVIVLFQDIDPNDPQWTEMQYECVSTMQKIKNSTQVITMEMFSNPESICQ